jgi:hypothetical protein
MVGQVKEVWPKGDVEMAIDLMVLEIYGANMTEEKMNQENEHTEEYVLDGDKVVAKIKEIIAAGNARRIIIKNEKDESLMEIPLTFVAVGALFAPVLAAVGALAALVTKCKIVVVKKD